MPPSTRRRAQAIGGLWPLAHRPGRARPSALPGTHSDQGTEIDELLATVGTHDLDLALRLTRRLCLLIERSVPPRAMEAAPVPRAARLRFADGTTVLVRGALPGDLAVLAIAMQRGSVRPMASTVGPEGSTHVLLAWPGWRHGLWLRVVGLDQPD